MKIVLVILFTLLFHILPFNGVYGQSDCSIRGPIHSEYCTYYINTEHTIYFNEDFDYLPLHFIVMFPYPNVKCLCTGASDNYLFLLDTSQCVYMIYDYYSHRNDTLFKGSLDYLSSIELDEFIQEKSANIINSLKEGSEILYVYRNDVLFVFFNVDIANTKRILESFCVLREPQVRRRH